MGYDFHVTRKEYWFDDAPEVTLEEWLAFVDLDPELRRDGYAEAPVGDGKIFRIESEDICVWTAYSGGASGKDTSWITWGAGNIVAKNPDLEIRQKLWRIAQTFDAKVQGDDGELYGEDGEMIEEEAPQTEGAALHRSPMPPSALGGSSGELVGNPTIAPFMHVALNGPRCQNSSLMSQELLRCRRSHYDRCLTLRGMCLTNTPRQTLISRDAICHVESN